LDGLVNHKLLLDAIGNILRAELEADKIDNMGRGPRLHYSIRPAYAMAGAIDSSNP
jgi:hypothetical protein